MEVEEARPSIQAFLLGSLDCLEETERSLPIVDRPCWESVEEEVMRCGISIVVGSGRPEHHNLKTTVQDRLEMSRRLRPPGSKSCPLDSILLNLTAASSPSLSLYLHA